MVGVSLKRSGGSSNTANATKAGLIYDQQSDAPTKSKGKSSRKLFGRGKDDKGGKWKAVVDQASGETYYYHTKTKEVTWEKPEENNDADQDLQQRQQQNQSKMKVAIVANAHQNHQYQGDTPATAASTPGAGNNASILSLSGVSTIFDQMATSISAAVGYEDGNSPENKDKQGERFANAPVWGLPPAMSDDDESFRAMHNQALNDSANAGGYDDIELVLQGTPERPAYGSRSPIGTPSSHDRDGTAIGASPTSSTGTGRGPTDLNQQLEAEALRQQQLQRQMQDQREKDEVVNAARQELLRKKEERAVAAAYNSSAGNNNIAGTGNPEDYVDASVAAALETWRSATDPNTGRTYYYNRVTKETKWDPPTELVEAYRSVVAKRAAMASAKANQGGQDGQQGVPESVGTGASTRAAMGASPAGGDAGNNNNAAAVGAAGAALAVGAGAAATAAVASSANNRDQQQHQHQQQEDNTYRDEAMKKSSGGKSIRKILGLKKSSKEKDPPTAQTVNGGSDMPDDELADTDPEAAARAIAIAAGAGAAAAAASNRASSGDRDDTSKNGAAAKSSKKKSLNPLKAVRSMSTRARKKKHGWRSVVDQTSGRTYYYHSKTKEVSWDKPEGFDEQQREEALSKRTRSGGSAKNRGGSKKSKTDSGTQYISKRNIWKATLDSKTGKTYYYHTKTKEVTWVKPDGYDEQQAQLKKQEEERRRRKAEEKERYIAANAAPSASAAAAGDDNAAPDPDGATVTSEAVVTGAENANLDLLRALATALPDEQDNHDKLLAKYKGEEDDLLMALEQLQEDTPFDECIEYDSIVAKMDQIKESRTLSASNILASATAAISSAITEPSEEEKKPIKMANRTYSSATGVTGFTGMRSEVTARVNNTTTQGRSTIPTISEGAEDGIGLSLTQSGSVADAPKTQLGSVQEHAGADDADADDADATEEHSVADSMSALSVSHEYVDSAGLRYRQQRRQKKVLGDAVDRKDWKKAQKIATEISREQGRDSRDAEYTAVSSRRRRANRMLDEETSKKEFSQSQLDEYIAANDWNSVAQYIAVMRSGGQNGRDKDYQPIRTKASYDSYSSAGITGNYPRKSVGARSQLQYLEEDDDDDSQFDTNSEYTDNTGTDWESLTSGPSYSRPPAPPTPSRTMRV